MSQTKRSTGGGKQAAARSERSEEPKVVKWEGLELHAPARLPSTITIDLGRIEAMERRGDSSTIGALYELVESLVGDGGMSLIRQALQNGVGEKYGPIDGRVYTDVLNAIMESYGTSTGESSASPTS